MGFYRLLRNRFFIANSTSPDYYRVLGGVEISEPSHGNSCTAATKRTEMEVGDCTEVRAGKKTKDARVPLQGRTDILTTYSGNGVTTKFYYKV